MCSGGGGINSMNRHTYCSNGQDTAFVVRCPCKKRQYVIWVGNSPALLGKKTCYPCKETVLRTALLSTVRKERLTMKPIVLLIDDDENLLSGLVRSLRNEPYQLLTAKSGNEAMLILNSREVDVLVIDECMPGMSSSDLLAWAVENAPDTVRIMLTGNATTSIAIRAINEGQVYNFFSKPCNDEQLSVVIRKAIEHRGLLTENRRLLEINRRQFCELQQFSKKLGLLARVVAKDLRNPLEKVTHSCFALTDQYADFFEPKAKMMLDNAVEAISEVQHIVDDMLNCARSNVHADLSSTPSMVSPAAEPVAIE
jgi:response regulator RpfG family c-di-GMP phosphodiesterase